MNARASLTGGRTSGAESSERGRGREARTSWTTQSVFLMHKQLAQVQRIQFPDFDDKSKTKRTELTDTAAKC